MNNSEHIDLVEGYVTIRTPRDIDVDDSTMTILIGGKKNYKVRREDKWVHGEIKLDRTQIAGLAYAIYRVIAMEEKKVERMKKAMRGEA
jgi:hypothetical protein